MTAKAFLAAIVFLAFANSASADLAYKLSSLTGYTVAASLTITGWKDSNGKKGDSFEGCDFDRVIIFDDSKILRCATYNYTYSYRPTAVILVRNGTYKMIVEDEVYDMNR